MPVNPIPVVVAGAALLYLGNRVLRRPTFVRRVARDLNLQNVDKSTGSVEGVLPVEGARWRLWIEEAPGSLAVVTATLLDAPELPPGFSLEMASTEIDGEETALVAAGGRALGGAPRQLLSGVWPGLQNVVDALDDPTCRLAHAVVSSGRVELEIVLMASDPLDSKGRTLVVAPLIRRILIGLLGMEMPFADPADLWLEIIKQGRPASDARVGAIKLLLDAHPGSPQAGDCVRVIRERMSARELSAAATVLGAEVIEGIDVERLAPSLNTLPRRLRRTIATNLVNAGLPLDIVTVEALFWPARMALIRAFVTWRAPSDVRDELRTVIEEAEPAIFADLAIEVAAAGADGFELLAACDLAVGDPRHGQRAVALVQALQSARDRDQAIECSDAVEALFWQSIRQGAQRAVQTAVTGLRLGGTARSLALLHEELERLGRREDPPRQLVRAFEGAIHAIEARQAMLPEAGGVTIVDDPVEMGALTLDQESDVPE